ncbi:hypothetical protein DMA11_22140 [Marinilabiliaceae bacterium JC017]|nr:hypothetical protein DMA11_22140 [Marinilabiliaceae bacterium JC017]
MTNNEKNKSYFSQETLHSTTCFKTGRDCNSLPFKTHNNLSGISESNVPGLNKGILTIFKNQAHSQQLLPTCCLNWMEIEREVRDQKLERENKWKQVEIF